MGKFGRAGKDQSIELKTACEQHSDLGSTSGLSPKMLHTLLQTTEGTGMEEK